jgi:hypothetical protein
MYAVLTENGPILLAERPTVGRHGILVGEEPDGEVIYLKEWDKVWRPTLSRLKHMAGHLPARQRALFEGGETDAGAAPTIE